MKKILFLLMCVLTLCSCSSKQEKARAIVEKYCYDYSVDKKAGETRYYKIGESLMSKSAHSFNAMMELDKLYGKCKKEESEEKNPSDNLYGMILDKRYYWNGNSVVLHEITYIYKGGSGGKVDTMFFVKDN